MRSLTRRSGSLTILFYHSVLAEADPSAPERFHAGMFGRHLDILARFYRVLPLPEALRQLESWSLPARSVCITFDDGYADNCTVALPMLLERGLHATFFVTTGVLNGGIMWNDIVRQCVLQAKSLESFRPFLADAESSTDMQTVVGVISAMERKLKYEEPEKRLRMVKEIAISLGTHIPDDVMMSSAQVRALADAGMEVGAHTVTHPILSRISQDHARREVCESKEFLEGIVGRSVDLFAYPNGVPGKDYLREHLEMVREAGFSAAVTTSPGTVERGIDLHQLPRFAPWSTSAGRFIWNCWQNSRKTPQVI